ncbi:MAG: dihydropteroate synthase [Treponema sp.]|nr:dihydropteroate synthase [Candidatus Treponema merdequi]
MLTLTFGSKKISTELPAFVMGIVNATPDSVYEDSRGGIERSFELIKQGADIIDIGGESTRPGFTEISCAEEIKRIIPVINAIRKKSNVVISVDTRKYEVMKAAYEAGADVLNDVAALEFDERLADFVASTELSVILMNNNFSKDKNKNPNLYNQNCPVDCQNGTNGTKNIAAIDSAIDYLKKRVNFANIHGISNDKIILDPGIGFGTTFEKDLNLIKNTDKLCELNYPVLMALSRKRCIGLMTASENQEMKTADKRLAGTLAAGIVSVQKGAKILRVHDVEESVDTLKVLRYTI